ncbi:hypothetical protein CsSME_00023604 [Camellia sinensis var. sinensis]
MTVVGFGVLSVAVAVSLLRSATTRDCILQTYEFFNRKPRFLKLERP